MIHKPVKLGVASLIGGLLILLPGCARIEEGLFGGAGSRIRFTAASTFDNGPSTKTVYSGTGAFSGSTLTKERINWENDDQLTINYVHGSVLSSADYKVIGVAQGSATDSDATVEVVDSGGELVWGEGSGDHVFHAMYPSRSFSAGGTSASLSGNTFSGVIPAVQTVTRKQLESGDWKYEPDMKYGYMVATTSLGSVPASGGVSLYFKPAMTAFEFEVGVKAGAPALTLNTFRMSSTGALTGSFTAKLDGSDAVRSAWTDYSASGTGNAVSVDFRTGGSGITIQPGASVTFTVFALPQTLHEITVTFGTSEGDRTLALKQDGSFISFAPCKKYRITNLTVPHWTYTIEVVDPVTGALISDAASNPINLYGHETVSSDVIIRSYRENNLQPGIYEPLAWKIQYTLDDGAHWTDLDASSGYYDAANNGRFTFTSAPSGTGVDNTTYAAGEPRTAHITGTNGNHIQDGDFSPQIARAHLQNAAPRGGGSGAGSVATAFDLSRHPVYGNIDAQTSQNTANAYVISAPGWYKFPLVYGNAIAGGADNKSAYWPAAATATPVSHPADPTYGAISYMSDINAAYNRDNYVQHYYLPQFYNGLNRPITSPYILTDVGLGVSAVEPVILWQDMDYVTDTAILPYPSSASAAPDNIGITGSGEGACIWFKIDAQDIRPGNVVIALRTKGGAKTILWSWHIWITDRDLTPTDQVRGIDLMPTNMGFIDGSDGAVDRYGDRALKFRALAYEMDGSTLIERAEDVFTVSQTGEITRYLPSVGSNPYYQWGRKDPIIPSLPGGGSRLIIPNPEYTDLPNPGGASIAMDILPASNTLNYASGINKPYKPIFNPTTTGSVGGPVYPYYKGYRLTKEDRGPFLFSQAMQCNEAGLTTPDDWYFPDAAHPDHFYIKPEKVYNFGPYTQAQMTTLLEIDPNPGSIHFHNEDFEAVPYTAAERSASALAYNLWNSFIYSDGVNTADNKYKTIYDPCPPGFTVPVRKLIVGSTWPLIWYDSQPGTPKHLGLPDPMSEAPTVTIDRTTSTKGVFYDGAFFPYTGGRILQYTNLDPMEQGTGAYYWTDNPFNLQAQEGGSDPTDPTDLLKHWFYQYGLILSTNRGGSGIYGGTEKAWSFTKGSGAAIRPMVDPHYAP